MKKSFDIRMILLGIALLGTAFGMPSCGDIAFNNLVIGVREGAVTAITGVVEETINTRFGLKAGTKDGLAGTGSDLFVNI